MLRKITCSLLYALVVVFKIELSTANTHVKSLSPEATAISHPHIQNRKLHHRSMIDRNCNPTQTETIQLRMVDAAEWAAVAMNAVRHPRPDDLRDLQELFFQNNPQNDNPDRRGKIFARYRGARHELLDKLNEGRLRISCAEHLSRICQNNPTYPVARYQDTNFLTLVSRSHFMAMRFLC